MCVHGGGSFQTLSASLAMSLTDWDAFSKQFLAFARIRLEIVGHEERRPQPVNCPRASRTEWH